jgi:glycosyltransferase involved in cell wall biosynthesis
VERSQARRALIDPLVDALSPSTIVACWVDPDDASSPAWPGVTGPAVATCTPRDLAEAPAADVVWICGRPNWHSLRALIPLLARRGGSPTIVVEGAVPPPVPPWSSNAAYAATLAREQQANAGLREGLEQLARALDPDATVLWFAPGPGAGVAIPAATARRLDSWLAGRRELLGSVASAEAGRDALIARNFELFELLDRAQRTGTAVVKSLRFRVGTRAVRTVRRLARKTEVFRAPREILARAPVVEQWRRRLAEERSTAALVLPRDALKVTFVLPELRLSGGSLVVSELVDELRCMGVDARIATLRARGDVFRMRFLYRPMVFDDVAAMRKELPAANLVVATHWSTAEWVRDLVAAGRAPRAAYFLQDYEAWFYPETDHTTRARVKASYEMIADKIATSAWLAEMLRADGYEARVVAPGLDLDVFYPRTLDKPVPPTVLAMARPRTPRRGFETVVATLQRVHDAVPHARLVLFGERLGEMPLPFPYRGAGVITDRQRLARLYSGTRVHFDGSDFQAFGRANLEAMACGAVSVITDTGGVREYARDGENSLLVEPQDPAAAADAIVRLLGDAALHTRLRTAGLTTAAGWSMRRRAREHLTIYEAIVSTR